MKWEVQRGEIESMIGRVNREGGIKETMGTELSKTLLGTKDSAVSSTWLFVGTVTR